MRRKICTILYKLGLRRAAHAVSPSIYFQLIAKESAKYFMQGMEKGIKEGKAMQTLEKAAQEKEG
jgi:hypothetical protein